MDKVKIIANIDVEACTYGFGTKEEKEAIEIKILELAEKLREERGEDA